MLPHSCHRTIAHFDLDAFYVSVERLKNKALIGKPIAVGGSSERGVVASCSYEARKFGVRSAMSTKLARRLCPELIVVKGDMESYSHFSREVTAVISDNVPVFEKSSIDEFYIDMTGMDRFFGAAKYVAELRQKIIQKTGLSISYGIASNKLISKVAAGEVKPNGEIKIAHGHERSFLAPLSISKMPMIGKRTEELLRSIGIDTIDMLSMAPVETLTNLLGRNGSELWRRANGIDDAPLHPYHEQKSMSTENTFHADTGDVSFLHVQLMRMTEQLAFKLRSGNRLAGCVAVKIRYSNFETFTMQGTIPYTCTDHLLAVKVRELFTRLYDRRLQVRLIGVRLSDLMSGNYQISLFDDTPEAIRLYQAIDHIKNKYGEEKLVRAAGARFSA